MKKAAIECGVAVGIVVLSGVGLVEAWGYRGGSGLMPRAVMAGTMGLAAIWAIQSVRVLRAPRAVVAQDETLSAPQVAGSASDLAASLAAEPEGDPAAKPIYIPPEQRRAGLVVAAGGLFLLIGMSILGFFTTAAIAVPAMAWGLGYRRPLGLLLGTACFIVLLLLVFRALLALPLPPEAIFTLFGG
ncbi:MAG: tripartite tricarboxylate transporter TctB family protein [Celeribacter sp.]|jgi:hypothetical protein